MESVKHLGEVSYRRFFGLFFLQGIGLELAIWPVGMFYYYLTTSQTLQALSGIMTAAVVVGIFKFVLVGIVTRIITRHLHKVITAVHKSEPVNKAEVQEAWLEIVNFPVRFSLYNSIFLSAIILLLPLGAYLYLQFNDMLDLVKFLAASVITILLMALVHFIIFEYAADSILIPFERAFERLINFRDRRAAYVSFTFRYLSLSIFIVMILILYISTISGKYASLMVNAQINPDFLLNNLKFEITLASFLILTCALGLLYLITSVNTVSLRHIADQMTSVKGGLWEVDLIDAPKSVVRDEIIDLISAFYTMMQKLCVFVAQIREVGQDVEKISANLVTLGGSESAFYKHQEHVIHTLTDLNAAFLYQTESIRSNAFLIRAQAQNIYGQIKGSEEILVHMTKNLKVIEQRVHHTRAQILELEERLTHVVQATRDVRKIAAQTKVIAFNASLESTNQTEMGRRFNVISEEIRKLTFQVMSSTDQIATIINDLQESASQALASSEREMQAVEQEVFSLQTGNDGLAEIQSSLQKTVELVERFTLRSDDYIKLGDSIARNIQSVTSVRGKAYDCGQKTTDSAQKISRVVAEMHTLLQAFQWKDDTPKQV